MDRDPLHQWKITGLIASLVIVLTVPLYVLKEKVGATDQHYPDSPIATFVGREQCIDCHEDAYESWRGSDHDRAMEEATDSTVLGDFNDAIFEYGDITARFYRRDGGFYGST